MDVPVRAAFWRGGTSRAVLLLEPDLAGFDERAREAVILAALGSPDPYGRQVDGLGGGISSLSKAAIIGRAPADVEADVTFRFAQVDVERPWAEFAGNCGNISAAVAPFALDAGLVEVPLDASHARVVVLSTNTHQRFVAHVPVREGRFDPEGDFAIDGVPGTGARIGLEYLEPGGSIGRGLLPTGMTREQLRLPDGRDVEVSIVDAANPMVFVRASDLGATATELPTELDARSAVTATMEAIRGAAAARIGMPDSRAIPKVAIVAPPTDYCTTNSHQVPANEVDLLVRMLSMGKTHRTIAMTTAICAAVAAALPGTVVAELARCAAPGQRVVRLGHPAGVLPIGAEVGWSSDGTWTAVSATTYRTARKIMDGCVYVPVSYLEERAWFQRAAFAAVVAKR
jgi:2-methylaconitate cis-trans-isomerase PrpF